MRFFFTLILVLSIVLSVSAAKKVAYVINSAKKLDATVTVTIENDIIIQMLQNDANFDVTVIKCDATGVDPTTSAKIDLSGFDIIVGQESFGSKDAIFMENGPLNLGTLPAPTLFNKIYSLQSGRALPSGTGKPVDAFNALNMTISPGQEKNPIFTGINASGGVFQVCKSVVTDGGTDPGTKSLQYCTLNVISEENTMLAYPEGAVDPVIGINDMPAGTTIDGLTLSSRVIFFNFNYGQLVANNASNLTDEGLLLWKNAFYILADLLKPTSSNDITAGKFNVARLGTQLNVTFGQSQDAVVSVYNVAGRLISKQKVSGLSASIEMGRQIKGVYLINVVGNKVNGTQKILLR